MKALISIIAAALVAISTTPAHAATARLLSCESGPSVTGRYGFIGVYEVYGAAGRVEFSRFFSSYCPYSVEVY